MGIFVSTANKRILKEYQVAVTTSPSTAKYIGFLEMQQNGNFVPGSRNEVILAAKGADITFFFGNSSSAAASNTVTSSELVQGNFTLLAGAIYQIALLADQNYVSAVGSGAGTAIIQILDSQY